MAASLMALSCVRSRGEQELEELAYESESERALLPSYIADLIDGYPHGHTQPQPQPNLNPTSIQPQPSPSSSPTQPSPAPTQPQPNPNPTPPPPPHRYEPRCYAFECVECLRKLALVGLPVFFDAGSIGQTTYGVSCAGFEPWRLALCQFASAIHL